MSFWKRTLSGAWAACLLAGLVFDPADATGATLNPSVGQKFFGNEMNWLMDPSLLDAQGASDPAALAEVSKLFQSADATAPLALQNYIGRYPQDPAAFDLAGVVLLQEQKYGEAVLAFARAISFKPDSAWLHAKHGAALVLAEQRGRALVQFERALKLDPDNPLALRHMAQFAVRENNLVEATLYSERALRAFGLPSGTVNQAHFDLAELYKRLHRNMDGLDLLRGAVDNADLDIPDMRKLELYGRYMDLAMGIGQTKEARSAYEKLKPMVDPNDPSVKLTDARLLRQEGDYIGAIAMLDAIVFLHPDLRPQLQPDRALVLSASGKHAEAADIWLNLAESAEPGQDLKFLEQAFTASISAGEGEAVAAEVQALAAAAPERVDLALMELEFLGKTAKTDIALGRAVALSQNFPENADIFRMLGTIQAASGDKVAARASLQRALEIAPKEPSTWLTLAGVIHGHGSYTGAGHTENGDHDEVENLLKSAISVNPASSTLHAELGLLYLSDGRVGEAILSFDNAVENNPAHMAGLSLGALARADASEDLGVALAMIDRARVMAPDDPINKDIMGWVLVRQGQIDDGLALLNEAAEAEPEDVTIQYHLGVAHEKTGNVEAARKHYLAALGGANYQHNVKDSRARLIAVTPKAPLVVDMARIDEGFEGRQIGSITIEQTPDGLKFSAAMKALPEGPYAAHVHEYANCGRGNGAPGSLAGGHYGHHAHAHHEMAAGDAGQQDEVDHAAMGHAMPMDAKAETGETGEVDHAAMGHAMPMDAMADAADAEGLPRGDLPPFIFDASQESTTELVHEPLVLDEIRGRTLMLHVGADVDGKSGPKIACGVIG